MICSFVAIASKSWLPPIKQKGTCPTGRRWHTSILTPTQKLLVYGGYNGNKNPLEDMWSFDLGTVHLEKIITL
jgi:hypothetical protein